MTIRLPEGRAVPGAVLAAFVAKAQRRQKGWHPHVFVADVDSTPALCVRCHQPETHGVHKDFERLSPRQKRSYWVDRLGISYKTASTLEMERPMTDLARHILLNDVAVPYRRLFQ